MATSKKTIPKVIPKKPKTLPVAPVDEIPIPTKEQVSSIIGKVHQLYAGSDDSIDTLKATIKEMRNLNLQLLTVINTLN
jgi:hypothetical protein